MIRIDNYDIVNNELFMSARSLDFVKAKINPFFLGSGRDSGNAFSSLSGLDPQKRELLEARFFDNRVCSLKINDQLQGLVDRGCRGYNTVSYFWNL